jgi:hypothetical protein
MCVKGSDAAEAVKMDRLLKWNVYIPTTHSTGESSLIVDSF